MKLTAKNLRKIKSSYIAIFNDKHLIQTLIKDDLESYYYGSGSTVYSSIEIENHFKELEYFKNIYICDAKKIKTKLNIN